MWLFKLCGMVLIFAACSIWGFSRSAALKHRAEKLRAFGTAAAELAELIRGGLGEIKPLLIRTFKGDLLDFEQDRFFVNEAYYKKEDIALLKEFFENLGLSDAESEYRRITGYVRLINERSNAAFSECESLCKLYKSLGCMIGIFICIFLL